MSTAKVPTVIDESELNELMTNFEAGEPVEAVIQAAKSYLSRRWKPYV